MPAVVRLALARCIQPAPRPGGSRQQQAWILAGYLRPSFEVPHLCMSREASALMEILSVEALTAPVRARECPENRTRQGQTAALLHHTLRPSKTGPLRPANSRAIWLHAGRQRDVSGTDFTCYAGERIAGPPRPFLFTRYSERYICNASGAIGEQPYVYNRVRYSRHAC